MKVLHIIDSLAQGGAEVLLTQLLPKLKEKNCEIVVVTRRNDVPLAPMLISKNILVFSLGFNGTVYDIRDFVNAVIKLKNIIENEKPDIIHSHLWLSDILAKLVAGKIPVVTTLHSPDPWWFQKKRIRSILKTKLEAFLSKRSNCWFIACSNSVYYAAKNALNISPDKIKTIYNGIDLEKFCIKSENNCHFTIIQIGRIEPRKGYEVSLRAFQILKKTVPQAKLWIVGKGSDKFTLYLEKLINDLTIRDVEFLGIRDDVPDLLRKADILWMPSDYEGFGIACIEAMASGLPVIATDVSSLNEVVINGETGYLIRKGDYAELTRHTINLFLSPDKMKIMGQAGRNSVKENFTIEMTADGYFSLYASIIGGQK